MPPRYEAQGNKLVARPAIKDAGGSRVELPWPQVSQVQVVAPVGIPAASAWVLIEGEEPRDLSWAPILAGALALFMLLSAWLLLRSLRAARRP